MARGRGVARLWSDVHGLLHLQLKNAAAVLHVSPSYLKHLCRRHGLPRWPGKTIRSLNAKLDKLTLELEAAAAREGSSSGTASRRSLNKIKQEIKKVHEGLISVYAPIRNRPLE